MRKNADRQLLQVAEAEKQVKLNGAREGLK